MYQYDDPTAVAVMPVAAALGSVGFFTDANPGGGIPATRLRADFMNSVMMELLNVITGAGIAPSKSTYTQLFTAIKTIVQQETGNYGADTGAANTYVVAYNPAVVALTDGLVLRFKAANANSGASTFAVNAIAAKAIVRDDGAGTALLAGDIPANAIIEVVYDLGATRFVLTSVNQNISTVQIQQQTTNYAAAAGTNTITATYAPAVGSHITGMPLRAKIAVTNSGAVTFNPGPSAKNVLAPDGSALIAGDLVAGDIVEFVYDGTQYLVQVVQASTTRIGVSRLATTTEARTGTAANLGVTPAGLASEMQTDSQCYILDSSGAANTITLTFAPAFGAYTTGMRIAFKLANDVTGAANINVNALGNKAVKCGGADPISGQLLATRIYEARYDGTNFQIINPSDDRFESAEIGLALTTNGTTAHGLKIARRVTAWLRCKTAEFGFAVGDEYMVVPNQDTGVHGIASYISGANLGYNISTGSVLIYRVSGGAGAGDSVPITLASWKLVLRASVMP